MSNNYREPRQTGQCPHCGHYGRDCKCHRLKHQPVLLTITRTLESTSQRLKQFDGPISDLWNVYGWTGGYPLIVEYLRISEWDEGDQQRGDMSYEFHNVIVEITSTTGDEDSDTRIIVMDAATGNELHDQAHEDHFEHLTIKGVRIMAETETRMVV